MKFMFIIQGEGRGHSTQAIALKEIIESKGHTVDLTIIGHRGNRPITMVKDSFQNVVEIQSPNLVYKKGQKKVSLFKTLKELIFSIPHYIDSLKTINQHITQRNPDVVINFYESMFGVYRMLYRPRIKSFVVGHQFMFFHPNYISMKSYPIQMWGAKLFTGIVGWGSEKIALSFYDSPKHKKIHVIPPVLRKQVFEVFNNTENVESYVLVYCINESYIYDFTAIPNTDKIKIFTEVESDRVLSNNVTVHPLNGEKFLRLMAGAKQVICTAGFETVAEALFMGKPVIMCPVTGHMEQHLNAKDAETRVGNCKKVKDFKNWRTVKIDMDCEKTTTFRNWINSGNDRITKILNL